MTNSNIETIATGAPWEKTGNTSWAQCPQCKDWFHVGPELLKRPTVAMHCPHCHTDFAQDTALRITRTS